MTPTKFVEALAYGLARGAIRAYYDIKEERARATDELITDRDIDIKKSFSAAVTGLDDSDASMHGVQHKRPSRNPLTDDPASTG